MQGLPIGTDFGPLIGRNIEMLRITNFHAHFLLNDDKPTRPDAWIDAATTLIFTDADKRSTVINDKRTEGGILCLLLGLTIESASRRDDGGLLLEMSTGIKLEILNDYSNYESIILHIGEKTIVG
jgi:hypothetical protein